MTQLIKHPSIHKRRKNTWWHRFTRTIRFLARPNTYTVILLVMTALLVVGTALVWIFEIGDPDLSAPYGKSDALVFMLQNVSGVGIGAMPPHTASARGVGITFVILASAMRAIFVAAVVSSFVNQLILRGKGVRRVDIENHVIICGWNPHVSQVVKTLQRDGARKVPVVLLAPINENPLVDYGVKFIKGDPTLADDLKRANAQDALAAIVITDMSDGQAHTDSTYDARAVLMVLALKSVDPDIHIVVEVRDPGNRRHFEHAKADEIVVSAEVSEGLVARAATNQGIAWVYEDLLRLDTSPEMYIIDTPKDLVGVSFQAALVRLNTRDNVILLGIVEKDKVQMCPPNGFLLTADTRLVVLDNTHQMHDK